MPGFSKNLQLRILSALVLAPLSLFCILYGSWPFYIFLAVLFAISLSEWFNLSLKTDHKNLFLFFGGVYLFLCFYTLFEIQKYTILAVLFVLMVWASDTGGYVFGKFIGGPKLAVKISPNKTWAGMAGAILVPYIIYLLWAWYIGILIQNPLFVLPVGFAVSFFFGIFCQAGDLLVSFLKRRAGAKDTGTIIPGHGGLLDRIDSLLMGGIYTYALGYVS